MDLLSAVPLDVSLMVFELLDAHGVSVLTSCSRSLRELASSNEVWQQLWLRAAWSNKTSGAATASSSGLCSCRCVRKHFKANHAIASKNGSASTARLAETKGGAVVTSIIQSSSSSSEPAVAAASKPSSASARAFTPCEASIVCGSDGCGKSFFSRAGASYHRRTAHGGSGALVDRYLCTFFMGGVPLVLTFLIPLRSFSFFLLSALN